MAPTYGLRLSRTLPNLPIVEDDAASVDSSGGGVPLYPPAPPSSPNSSYRVYEEFRIPVLRGHNCGTSRSSFSSDTTHVNTGPPFLPLRNTDAIDHRDSSQREQMIAGMATSLDPTTASFEPVDARFQPVNRSGGAGQLNHDQNADNISMKVAENDDNDGMQQIRQRLMANANVPVSQAQVTYTANMQQRDQQMMPTFQGGPIYQSQPVNQPLPGQNQTGFIVQPQGLTNNQEQQFTIQTPNNRVEDNVDRFTPGTYRFTPKGSNGTSITTRSPMSSVTGYPPSTEPRSFAPRTSGLVPREPPPRFALQIPVQTQQTPTILQTPAFHSSATMQTQTTQQSKVHHHGHGGRRPLQQGAGQHTFPSNQTTTIVSGNDDRGFDPFRTVELPRVIQPIEPISNALVMQAHTVPEYIRSQRSKQLNDLTAGPRALPTIEVALHPQNFPFTEGPRNAQPSPNWGVLKIKNIPFSAKRSEVIAFLGRNSRVLNDRQEPIHIIMERVTSKTNDCYVEFMSMHDAVHAVERYNRASAQGRQSRLGDRPVEIELSSPAALMKDLFPHANGIRWEGARPVVLEDHPTEPWSCFKGFITDEEMICLVKHVEVPQRSPFSRDCPQRPYECMISTLHKLPWYMAEYITIQQRHAVYKAVLALITRLQGDLRLGKFEEYLTEQLYRRLWTSAMLCDGFTVTMKDNIAYTVGLSEEQMRGFNMPRYANLWSHQYTMVPKVGTPLDVIEWYIAIIREETERRLSLSLPNVQAAIRQEAKDSVLYWGWLFKELDLPYGAPFDNMTLAEMATREFTVVTDILRRAFA